MVVACIRLVCTRFATIWSAELYAGLHYVWSALFEKLNFMHYLKKESHRPVRGERSFTFSESTPPRNGACD